MNVSRIHAGKCVSDGQDSMCAESFDTHACQCHRNRTSQHTYSIYTPSVQSAHLFEKNESSSLYSILMYFCWINWLHTFIGVSIKMSQFNPCLIAKHISVCGKSKITSTPIDCILEMTPVHVFIWISKLIYNCCRTISRIEVHCSMLVARLQQ